MVFLAVLVSGFGVLALLLPLSARAINGKAATSDRPGDVLYTPTKLEWAALELQADFGRNWTNEDHVAISYMQGGDGKTIQCSLQYTPDVSAQALKTSRDVAQVLFDRYKASRSWSWLRLQFEEHSLPAPH
jgi:hypothetical protein